jgi:ABC-2 type transport system ATP-binding protein
VHSPSGGIALKDVAFEFVVGQPVLRSVSFRVHRGETVALLGENGAGKTTLLSLCLGFLRPTAGSVQVEGENPWLASRALRSQTAYVPEVARIYPHLTGAEVIKFFSSLSGRPPSEERLSAFLADVRFPVEALGRATGSYSKGMRQKLALALGFLKGAGVFILDEPTSGLDPTSRRDLAAALLRLSDDGCALLIATHDLELATEARARVLTLEGGCAQPEDDRRPPSASRTGGVG